MINTEIDLRNKFVDGAGTGGSWICFFSLTDLKQPFILTRLLEDNSALFGDLEVSQYDQLDEKIYLRNQFVDGAISGGS